MWLQEAINCGRGLAFIRLNGKLFRLIIIAQLSLGEKYSLCFWFVLYNFYIDIISNFLEIYGFYCFLNIFYYNKFITYLYGRSFTNEKAKRSSKPQVQSSVWIPATGKKYHRIPNCGNMNPNRARKVTLSQAKQRGYTACKKCYR